MAVHTGSRGRVMDAHTPQDDLPWTVRHREVLSDLHLPRRTPDESTETRAAWWAASRRLNLHPTLSDPVIAFGPCSGEASFGVYTVRASASVIAIESMHISPCRVRAWLTSWPEVGELISRVVTEWDDAYG